jgi:hypothetical protein
LKLLIISECKRAIEFQGKSIALRRTETASFLELLLRRSFQGRRLTAQDWESDRFSNGAVSQLTRSQIARVIKEVQQIAHEHADLGITLKIEPRKLTVGPWVLQLLFPFDVQLGTSLSAKPGSLPDQDNLENWPYPELVNSNDLDCLYKAVKQSLIFEGCALFGDNQAALESIPDAAQFSLSFEAEALMGMRRAYLYRRSARYPEALQIVTNIATSNLPLRDSRIVEQARFTIARIHYESDPVTNWQAARALANRPLNLVIPCASTRGEWHNLQALCARRAAIDFADNEATGFNGEDQKFQGKQLSERQHRLALAHYQSALYYALSLQNWDRLHAYIDNLCYHLQKMFELGFVNLINVVDWFSLSLACAEKLDSGHDDAWGFVYLAEFWLDHYKKIQALGKLDPQRFNLMDASANPTQPDFWKMAIGRSERVGDPRQVAIILILFMRWQEAGLASPPQMLTKRTRQLDKLLKADGTLKQRLESEGYWVRV